MVWLSLINFMSLVSFYTPWNYHKTKDVLMFSGGVKKETSDIKCVNISGAIKVTITIFVVSDSWTILKFSFMECSASCFSDNLFWNFCFSINIFFAFEKNTKKNIMQEKFFRFMPYFVRNCCITILDWFLASKKLTRLLKVAIPIRNSKRQTF